MKRGIESTDSMIAHERHLFISELVYYIAHERLSFCFCISTISTADVCNNCAFNDRSMKLGTLVKQHESKTFGYRAPFN